MHSCYGYWTRSSPVLVDQMTKERAEDSGMADSLIPRQPTSDAVDVTIVSYQQKLLAEYEWIAAVVYRSTAQA